MYFMGLQDGRKGALWAEENAQKEENETLFMLCTEIKIVHSKFSLKVVV